MLQSLQIQNYAIIKEVTISFDKRLNIITGETGAGKSIIMGALGLILGERADNKILHTYADKCIVEGLFDITPYNLSAFFNEHELDYDSTCVIRREITANGKSRAFINDTPVNLHTLRQLGEFLIDIVSQHQTLELNDSSFQLNMVDEIADTTVLLKEYAESYNHYKTLESTVAKLIAQEQQSKADEDYYQFQLNELQEANIKPNEQEQLEKNLELLNNADAIQQSAGKAAAWMDNNEENIITQLVQIKLLLQPQAKFHQNIKDLINRLDSCIIELKDIAAECEQISEQTQANPEQLLQTEERLQLLFSLQKKHRVDTNSALLIIQSEIEKKLQNIGTIQAQIEDVQQQLIHTENSLIQLATKLTHKRTKAIPEIEKNIQKLLAQVAMPDAQLIVKHSQTDSFTPSGKDDIQFLFSANKGQPLQHLQKVASGGELSRLMLCIKSLISDKIALPSIVFDEIDTGISGETALKVAQVMKQHSKHHQVIAITHLPQIAGKADAHFYVSKSTKNNETSTLIKRLNETEQLEEIARMLHGAKLSAKVLEAAKELIG
jgi:DNA repair protein RecN (Recombination protein N)